MPYVKTKDGTDLYVKDWGSGRPIVLIHGWPLNADSWDDQAMALADAGHRVIAYDRRGFGRSSQPYYGYDYDTFADDLASIVEAAGLNDFALAGFSMGGGEIARYMSRHDGRGVRSACLVSSVVPHVLKSDANPDGVPGEMLDKIKDGLKKDRAHFLAGFFQDFFGVGWISSPVSDEVIHWATIMALQASLKATIACVDAFGRTDFTGDLPAFRVPTTVIHGTADKTVPTDATGRVAAAAITGARLIEYDGDPHAVWATSKDRFTRDILDFAAI